VRLRIAVLVGALALLGAAEAAAATRLSPRSRLSTAGLGPVKVGMTVRQAQRAGRKSLVADGQAFAGCRYVRPRDRRIRASFMVIRGRIARVDVWRRGIRTVSGLRVGDAESTVRRRFRGRLRISRHVYEPGGHYLEFVPRDAGERRLRMVFETSARHRITYIRAGRLPAVRYVEGCA
jgi:hypothetical protein